jgi:tripartite-type tricarboxylate transporter receptor subunit TctC
LIVPRQAGGVLDVVGRHWGTRVAPVLGSIVIENVGGGGGTIGTAAAARAEPDGYSLLLGSTSDLVLNPLIMSKLPYDPVRDFRPVAILAVSVSAIAVHPSVPVKTLPELVAYAKDRAGELSYGSAGVGTMANLCGELFKQLAGLAHIVHVPYKGGARGFNDLVSGHIPIMSLNISTPTLELHRSGRIRILAAATDHKLVGAPEIPIAAEAGYPGWIAHLSTGIFAPAKTPAPVIEVLAKATQNVMADPEFRKTLIAAGQEPVAGSGPAAAAKYLADEVARWAPVVEAAGMKMN